MSIQATLAVLQTEFGKYNGFIRRAHQQDTAGSYYLSGEERSFVVEQSFLRLVIAWETYLEQIYVKYLTGQPSIKGRTPIRHATPPTEESAHKMLIGTQKYVDWLNPEIVRRLAEIYFDKGEPMSTNLGSINQDLLDLKNIRNAAAHLTSTTGRSLDTLATKKLNKPCTGIRVIDFVLALDPNSAPSRPLVILDTYLTTLEITAENIANY